MGQFQIYDDASKPTYPCAGGTGCWDNINQQWAPCSLCFGITSSNLATPSKLKKATINVGKNIGLATPVISKYESLTPYRGQMLAYLRQMNVPVKDVNNLYEIAILYAATHPFTRQYLNSKDLTTAMEMVISKNKYERFDFGALFSGIADAITGIINGVNEAANNAELQQWYNAFGNYMQTDFRDIQNQFTRFGAPYALAWLLNLKSKSWKDLRNYNDNWLRQKGMAKPQQIIDLQDQQRELEIQLTNAAAAMGAVLPTPNNCRPESGTDVDGEYNYNCRTTIPVGQKILPYNSNPYAPPAPAPAPAPAPTPTPTPTQTPQQTAGGKFDIMKFINDNLIVVAGAAIVLVLILKKK